MRCSSVVLLLPRIAAFGYFAVAAYAVLSPRGEGRLTLAGRSVAS